MKGRKESGKEKRAVSRIMPRWMAEARRASLLLLLLAGCLIFAGCGYSVSIGEEGLVITRALKENELARIGNEAIRVPEAKLFLLSEKARIESVYGSDFFTQVVVGKPAAEYLNEDLKSFLIRMLEVSAMADSMGVTLNNTELDRVSRAASDLYNSLTVEYKEYTGVGPEDLKAAFSHYYRMQKVLDRIQGSMNVEISDDEARVITIQQIFVTEYGYAEDVLRRAANGTDFERLGSIYNESGLFTRTVSRLDLPEVYQKAVFSLPSGALSEIFEADGGYYVVKCLNNYEMELTMENKKTLATRKVGEEFERLYEEFSGRDKLIFSDEIFSTFSFIDDVKIGGQTFYDVYRMIFQ